MRVPYTILRGNTYHFNKRIGDQFFRISLKTKLPDKALVLSARLNSYLVEYDVCEAGDFVSIAKDLIAVPKRFKETDFSIEKAVNNERSEADQSSPLISKLVSQYLKEKRRKVAKSSLRRIELFLGIYLEICGDKTIEQHKRGDAVRFMDEVYSYPKNRTRGRNKSKTLEQLKLNGAPKLHIVTVKDAHNKVSSFLKLPVRFF